MKRIIIAILLLFLAGLVFAQTENDFDVMQLPDGTLSITRYKGPGGNITIPARLFGIAVSEIEDGASEFGSGYYRLSTTPSVIIERGIKKIGDNAFCYGGLQHINLPDTLVEIGHGAFHNNNLQELNIPKSITKIEEYTFNAAFGANFPPVLYIPSHIKSIGWRAFGENWKKSDGNRLKELVIESVFTIIPSKSYSLTCPFEDVPMEYLEKITFPANWPDPQLDWLKLPTGFVNYYKSQGRKAGTYVRNGQIWTYSGPAARTQTSSSSGGSAPLPPANAPSQSSSGQVALPPANTANQSSSDQVALPPDNAALPSSASTTGATGGTDDFLPTALGMVFGIIFWTAVIIFIVKKVKNRKKTGLL